MFSSRSPSPIANSHSIVMDSDSVLVPQGQSATIMSRHHPFPLVQSSTSDGSSVLSQLCDGPTPSTSKQTFPFLRLPTELRLMILKFVFGGHSIDIEYRHTFSDQETPSYRNRRGMQMIQTCRNRFSLLTNLFNPFISYRRSDFDASLLFISRDFYSDTNRLIYSDNRFQIPIRFLKTFVDARSHVQQEAIRSTLVFGKMSTNSAAVKFRNVCYKALKALPSLKTLEICLKLVFYSVREAEENIKWIKGIAVLARGRLELQLRIEVEILNLHLFAKMNQMLYEAFGQLKTSGADWAGVKGPYLITYQFALATKRWDFLGKETDADKVDGK